MSCNVHFEQLEQADRINGIARLLLRRNRLTPHLLVLCPDDDFMRQLSEKLWTIQPESFLAHGMDEGDSEKNAVQPILLSTSINRDNQAQVLVNGGLEVPTDLSGFSHIVDFVDGWDDDLKQAARERWKTYIQLSFEPTYLNKK